MKRLFLVTLAAVFCSSLFADIEAAPITITAANFVPSSQAKYLPGKRNAAVTLTAGQLVYIDTAADVAVGQVKLASATGTGLSTQVIGFVAQSVSAGQPCKIVIRDPALVLGGTVAAGAVLVLGVNGAINPAADIVTTWYAAVIGVGIGSNKINFGGTKFSGDYTGVIRADVATP